MKMKVKLKMRIVKRASKGGEEKSNFFPIIESFVGLSRALLFRGQATSGKLSPGAATVLLRVS